MILPRGGPKGIQRELLTLAVLLDCLLDGNILGSMDVISQRMKWSSCNKARMALQVEIITRESLGLTGDSEARYKEYTGEKRLARQLKGNPPAQGKGGWKESSKDLPFLQKEGKKGGDRFNQEPKEGRRVPE